MNIKSPTYFTQKEPLVVSCHQELYTIERPRFEYLHWTRIVFFGNCCLSFTKFHPHLSNMEHMNRFSWMVWASLSYDHLQCVNLLLLSQLTKCKQTTIVSDNLTLLLVEIYSRTTIYTGWKHCATWQSQLHNRLRTYEHIELRF